MKKNNLPTIEGDIYNYYQSMYDDVKAAIEERGGLDAIERDMGACYSDVEGYLDDELFTDDAVTGNGSGSYWFSSYRAQCALIGNLDLLGEAITEFDDDAAELCTDPEKADVTIRCYLLGHAISEVVSDLRAEEEENAIEAQEELNDALTVSTREGAIEA